MAITTPSQPAKLNEEQPLVPYRSVAPLAIVAVVLGVASALILTTPLLAPLPVAGIVVGIAALRSIAAARGQLAGRVVAIAGLCLATFFLGFGLSRHLARQSELEKVARGMADVFLKLLVEGKPREAHQFRLTPSSRITAPEAIAEHYDKNTEAAGELKTFVGSGVIRDLIELGQDAAVQFEGVSSATRDGKTDILVLRYSCAPMQAGGPRQSLWLHINRKYDESTKRHEWEIGGIQNTPPVGSGE